MSDLLIVGVLAILFLISIISGRLSFTRLPKEGQARRDWWTTWLQGLSTEMAGAFITGLFLSLLVTNFQNAQLTEQARADKVDDLIFKMGSSNNVVALEAIRQLRDLTVLLNGDLTTQDFSDAVWTNAELQDADLHANVLNQVTFTDADLSRANLTSATLQGAVLTNTTLTDANLSAAVLANANLEEADLRGANLTGADLQGVLLSQFSLAGANLTNANLQGLNLSRRDLNDTILTGADLRGTNLLAVDLTGKDLTGVKFDQTTIWGESTILPDGTNWTPETDMNQFTGGES